MNYALKIINLVIVSIIVIIVAGCASTKDSWFHGDYPNFKPGPEGGADLIEIKAGVDHTKYKFIFMDPVSFHYESSTEYSAIPPEVRKDLRKAFHSAIAEALGNAYPIVDRPRPDALRVRVAITGMVPAILAADPSHPPVSVGGSSMKAEILDSFTNERVGAVIDRKKGNIQKAVGNMDEWEHTREVFNYWAQRLRNWLDRTHVKK
jgi:hypothetical protein